MRNITAEGPYQGRNIMKFDEDDGPSKKEAKSNAYLDSIRESNQQKVNLVQESDAQSVDSEEEQQFLKRMQKTLDQHKTVDDKLALDRLKEKRIKSKKRRRGAVGEADEAGDREVVLGNDADYGSEQDISQSERESDLEASSAEQLEADSNSDKS